MQKDAFTKNSMALTKHFLSPCCESVKLHWEAGLSGYGKERWAEQLILFTAFYVENFMHMQKQKEYYNKPLCTQLQQFSPHDQSYFIYTHIQFSLPLYSLDYFKIKLRHHSISSVNVYEYTIHNI